MTLIVGQVLQGHLENVGKVKETIGNDILIKFLDPTNEQKKAKKKAP